jgi:hypothetical protein
MRRLLISFLLLSGCAHATAWYDRQWASKHGDCYRAYQDRHHGAQPATCYGTEDGRCFCTRERWNMLNSSFEHSYEDFHLPQLSEAY